jgi:hypothetical protein
LVKVKNHTGLQGHVTTRELAGPFWSIFWHNFEANLALDQTLLLHIGSIDGK